MEEEFKIFVDRLKHGEVEEIDESYDPSFLAIQEKELVFPEPVNVQGEAYIAEGDLVLRLDIDTKAIIPCRICNNPVNINIGLEGHYHIVPLSEIKSGVYSVKDHIRETLLLETPQFAECDGMCPEREKLKHFFSNSKNEDINHPAYQPFQNLKLGEINQIDEKPLEEK